MASALKSAESAEARLLTVKFNEDENTVANFYLDEHPLLRAEGGDDNNVKVWPRKLNSYVWPRPHGRREANPNYKGHCLEA